MEDDEVFADAYHSLVHSPLLVSLLRKESALNSSIRESFRKKGNELAELRAKYLFIFLINYKNTKHSEKKQQNLNSLQTPTRTC